MTQDTRKDPRAKVLTMTVRYKSATLDEFIEHHSHDVSRGGMFIKTPSPFPPGTLLKFEVKIAAEQRVMQGVGRVVWKRESSDSSESRPAGMGVKFIKIDDESRKVIDQLVVARGEVQSNFDQGADLPAAARSEPAAAPAPAAAATRLEPGVRAESAVRAEPTAASESAATAARAEPATPAAAAAAALKVGTHRKSTMIGLGSMVSGTSGSAQAPAPASHEGSDAFFPKTDPERDMPAPEDRTVMKQAAELLQEALRGAGGSMDEVGTPAVTHSASAPSVSTEAKKESKSSPEAAPALTPTPKPVNPLSAAAAKVPQARPPAGAPVAPTAARPLAATQPANRPNRTLTTAERPATPAESGGAGKMVLALAAVAVIGGIVFFATREDPAEAPPPAAAEAPPPPPAPVPQPELTAAPPQTAAAPTETAAVPSAVAAGTASAGAEGAAPIPGAPTGSSPQARAPAPEGSPAPPASPATKPRPTRPKATKSTPTVEGTAPAAPTEPTQPTQPTQPTPPAAEPPAATPPAAPPKAAEPTEPKPAPAPKPAAAAKPAPLAKPAPAAKPTAPGDNPY